MKTFSIPEAQALIPELEEIFSHAVPIHAQAQAKARSLSELEASSQDPAQLAIERAQLQFLVNAMNAWLQRIVDLGAFPKGVDPALVDFPHRLGGREVLLCWRLGEKTISAYHGTEEGFSGRRDLPRKTRSA